MKRNLFIIYFLLTLLLGLSIEAGAFSLQPRGGGGRVTAKDIKEDRLFYSLGLDMFIYEGKYLDLFVGAEYSGFEPISWDSNFSYIKYSAKITAATFGIYLKPPMKGRWKPYLSLGGIGGSVNYSIEEFYTSTPLIELLSKPEDSTTFIVYRGGIGTNIGLGKRFSLGIEINYTGSVPAFKIVVGDRSEGELDEIKLFKDSYTIGLNLGLRYYF